jgi:hypothetical protein
LELRSGVSASPGNNRDDIIHIIDHSFRDISSTGAWLALHHLSFVEKTFFAWWRTKWEKHKRWRDSGAQKGRGQFVEQKIPNTQARVPQHEDVARERSRHIAESV